MERGQNGGKREGAGRKKGMLQVKEVLTPDERLTIRQTIDAAKLTGELPLEYMLRVMRDETADEKRRDAMAMAAGPFVHARLASVAVKGDAEHPIAYTVVSGVPRQLTVIEDAVLAITQDIIDGDDARTNH